jgi:S-DNA-T family DNA segregation ATPase FtsK/SpoIIIE
MPPVGAVLLDFSALLVPARLFFDDLLIGAGLDTPMWTLSAEVTFYFVLPLVALAFFRYPRAGLLIAAFGPIIYTLDNRRRKKQMRADADNDQAEYLEASKRYEAKMADFRNAEVRRARLLAAGGGQSALLARYRHRRVWERRPADHDFLGVTLGYAALKSTYVTKDEAKSSSGPTLWQAPLAISLATEGPLSITGPLERAAAVTRSLLTELTFTHAPVDVNVLPRKLLALQRR